MKKKLAGFLCIVMAGLILAGCGAPGQASSQEGPASSAGAEEAPSAVSQVIALSPQKKTLEFEDITLEYSEDMTYEPNDKGDAFLYFEDRIFVLLQKPEVDLQEITAGLADETFAAMEKTYSESFDSVSFDEKTTLEIGGSPAYMAQAQLLGSREDVYEGDQGITFVLFSANDVVYNLFFISKLDKYAAYHPYVLDIINSITVVEPPVTFLSGERAKEFSSLHYYHDYEGMQALINTYIEAENPDSTDIAHRLLELAQSGAELKAQCITEEDEFDGKQKIFYPGVTAISQSVNLVPFIESSGMKLTYGFVKSGWHFFTSTSLKLGDDTFLTDTFNSFDINRDVLGGSSVKEEITTGLYSFALEKLQSFVGTDYTPVLRFTNDDDEHYDHTLTAEETAALSTLAQLEMVHDEINTLYLEATDQAF